MKTLSVAMTCGLLLSACAGGSHRAEIEQRREALELHQQTELDRAREQLALTDSALQEACRQYDRQHQWVMEHASQLDAASAEVQELNRLRAHRDSLQAEWQTLGAKIKYIKRRMDEGRKKTGDGET